ncbi:hypothetical protein KGM_202668 [Danaus plexippus plexippus]|uniref:Uncharacterized protein n=1 Tax=Danaus plexippus plexippus TaxID=278856 RepID=A0A212EMX2_DANPL|nr:hypothetical protein KGM_202668 [Danaus plexippus plexippus]
MATRSDVVSDRLLQGRRTHANEDASPLVVCGSAPVVPRGDQRPANSGNIILHMK